MKSSPVSICPFPLSPFCGYRGNPDPDGPLFFWFSEVIFRSHLSSTQNATRQTPLKTEEKVY